VLTEGEPRSNRSGSLLERIEIWSERVARLTPGAVKRRAGTALTWLLARGLTRRAHLDVGDPHREMDVRLWLEKAETELKEL
jgi:cytosine deaminase